MEMPFHFRALDRNGNSVRQSCHAFPTVESAQEAALRETYRTGENHVVCVSLDANDTANDARNPLKFGFKVYVAPKDEG